ncbi:VTT domain-containing protein [Luteolibacter sp. LG18]|uniref:TVP38/TMEM64 family protein n=1 Tax=Luteolibacter sp. LG18 TaxID=2819286 RepID=UPI002B2AFCB8|nr:hypothetical protein llg_09460 [Luteolibacter sp. LG18]
MNRIVFIFLLFAGLVIAAWLAWGGRFETMFSREATVAWLEARPGWGGLAGAGLLVSDLLLPVPGTVVMSALGYVYGVAVGGLLAAAGSIGAGIAGYGVGRLLPERTARKWIGEKDFERSHRLFSGGGGWMIALSRALPVLPEALSCTAGAVRMPFGRFLAAVACGSVPTGFVFAWIGTAGRDTPGWAMALSLVVPAILWLAARPWLKRL